MRTTGEARDKRLQLGAAVVLGAVGLVLVCWGPGWICLSLSAAFALFGLAPVRVRQARTLRQRLAKQLG